ncbi:ABC transporter substrate-binding protein [Rhodococcus qingshengii]|uniref:ABC transporter substrate-binding protein n=1 Tax=Rhodococcus qingshengii TaxID=334542 RepID=UPI0022B2F47C|nr:ABC transporter substrate-binding protein [Rhodococcus qingshengii]MCZ4618610.1 ABC transporter substrate-binding protein [Rhodococcus qingshengii]
MRYTLAPVFAVIAVLVLGACSGGSSSDDGGLDKIKIGVIPIADVAPLYLAREKGIFAEHGLEVEFAEAAGGAALIPAVVSGDYDYAFSNLVSLAVATSKGLPLKVVAAGASSTGIPGADFGAVMTKPDSAINEPVDLVGRRIAVNALSSVNEMLVKERVEQDGGDASKVQFVELPHSDMPAALDRGDVDAIWEVEPFLTSIRAGGAKEVWSLYAEAFPDLTVATYFTTAQRIASDSDQVRRFYDALIEAYAYANEHDAEVRAALSQYTSIDPATASAIVLPAWPSAINTASVQFQLDTAQKWNLIGDGDVNLDGLIAEGGTQ